MGKVIKNSLGYDSNLYVYQDKDMFNYSVDTILLGNFASINSSVKRLLEVGTNNGALSIFISERKKSLKIDAIEIQKEAIKLAAKNIELNKKEKQINLINDDFKKYVKFHTKNQIKKYHSIICNPPFYKLDSSIKRKGSDLLYNATHEVNLNLEQLIKGSSKIIEQKGYLSIVEPTERLVDIFVLMRKYNFEPKRVQFVHPREDQKSNLVLVEGRFQAGWGTHFLKNLYLHTNNLNEHKYRNEIKKLYKPIKIKEKKMSKKTFYITTPIYYPSGNLHIGHVYTTTLAWTIANYKKLRGYDTKFLTGSDEHGQKIQLKAQSLGMEPKKYVDKMSKQFQELWNKLEITYDYYSRTTNKFHEEAVSKQFSELLAKNIIYKGNYTGLYSVQDEEFFTKVQALKKDGKYYHPVSNHELELVSHEAYFFKMSKFADWLIKYIKDNPDFIVPKKIVNELMENFLNKGLEDLSISRNNFNWGISVKEDPEHVLYVWLDALNNYITALGYNSNDDSDFQKYWVNGDEIVHLVGKEITRFHCIYWPIILKAADIKLPNKILSHGWIITPQGKMSKSKGNVIDPVDLIEEFGVEQVKYFFAAKIKMGEDGIFDKVILKNVINSELVNNYGNLVSRTLAMIQQNFKEPVKYFEKKLQSEDKNIFKSIENHKNSYISNFDNFEIDKAFSEVILLSKKLNGYIDLTKPWDLKDNLDRLEVVLNALLNGIYAITTMLSVVMPNKCNLVKNQLGIENIDLNQILNWGKFDETIVQKGPSLFERIK